MHSVDPSTANEDDDHQIQALNARRDGPPIHQISADDVEYSRASAYALWKHMVYAKGEDDYIHTWDILKTKFKDQFLIINYLKEHYLP